VSHGHPSLQAGHRGHAAAAVSDFADITDKKKKPEKSLLVPLRKGSRNNQVICTVRGGYH
jgi:large subunit ribosomal protein L2